MDEILDYCSTTWGVTFPVFDKVKVNGGKAAPVYKALKKAEDVEGKKGPILWNFEKFVLTPEGEVHRFRPQVKPDDPAIVARHRGAPAALTAGRRTRVVRPRRTRGRSAHT